MLGAKLRAAAYKDTGSVTFATWDPSNLGTDATLSNGNLRLQYGSASTRTATPGNLSMTSGKWYWEIYLLEPDARLLTGIANTNSPASIGLYPGVNAAGWSWLPLFQLAYHNGSTTSFGSVGNNGDIIGVAFDLDAGELSYYLNGVAQGVAHSGIPAGTYYPAEGDGNTSRLTDTFANFGQDSSFGGLLTAQGNTDSNGVGDFYYTPPTGYSALYAEAV